MNLQELLGVSDMFWNFCQFVFAFHFVLSPFYLLSMVEKTNAKPESSTSNRKS